MSALGSLVGKNPEAISFPSGAISARTRWNHEFIARVQTNVSALLAGTGLRAGEALGLEIGKHISEDFRTLRIRQKVRRAKVEHFLKTDAGHRDVDLPSSLAEMLKDYVGDRALSFPDESIETWLARPLEQIGAAKSRLSCVPSLPSHVAQEESRPYRLGALLAGT